MSPWLSIIAIIIFAIIFIFVWIRDKRLEKNISEPSYQRYAKFYGNTLPTEQDFINKLKIIYQAIVKNKETDIKKIARQANCTYIDCILKIRYLKNKRKLADYYYIDEVNGIINKCSKEDQKLLKKYKLYIYNNHFQIDEIASKLPEARMKNQKELQEEVFKELCYLDDKDLINGIILNKVDGTITYYNTKEKGNKSDKITVTCQNCGAPNKVNRGGKTWCSYCGTIVEDKSLEEK